MKRTESWVEKLSTIIQTMKRIPEEGVDRIVVDFPIIRKFNIVVIYAKP